MAYPTGVAFKSTVAPMGTQPIHESSLTKLHELGTLIRATDVTYGEGEFIYLIGVASTAQGDVCTYNSKTGATIRAVSGGTGSKGPIGVAMSATDATSKYGWYQISGSTPVNSATVSADTDVYLTSTAGQVDDLIDIGDKVDGASFKAATVSGYATLQFSRASVAKESVDTAYATSQTDISTNATNIATLTTQVTKGFYCTLSAAAESANAIVVTGQIKNLGTDVNVAIATEVVFRSLAVTADKGDLTVTTGTSNKVVNPATGENVAWITSDAAGAFVVSVANDAAEITLVSAAPDNGLVQMLKLTYT